MTLKAVGMICPTYGFAGMDFPSSGKKQKPTRGVRRALAPFRARLDFAGAIRSVQKSVDCNEWSSDHDCARPMAALNSGGSSSKGTRAKDASGMTKLSSN
jgi:hypothetical protein